MKHLFYRVFSFIKNIKNNIAFFPTLLAIAGFVFATLMIIVEERGISKYLLDTMPTLVMEDGDTVLTLLSVCIGGLISMMVFSFSMVMLLLSQASSNFSPRLLPGLISDKRHQIILGFYLSAIIYNIFTMFNIEPTGEKYTLPGFSVLLGILFTIVCLCAFIYFIHNISQSIQISNILDDIYETAFERLQHIIKLEDKMDIASDEFNDTSGWFSYTSKVGGYFQTLSIKNVVKFCKEHDTKIHITIPKGLFVLKNEVFYKSKKQLTEEQLEDLETNIYFSKNELVDDNYSLAFKQITEIAVKAMSPGINDPGTAVNAIDYLTELFALRLKKNDIELLTDEDMNEAYFKLENISFNDLIYNVMASLRTYCSHDPVIVQKLLTMLMYLRKQPMSNPDYKTSIENQMEILIRQSESSFDSRTDRKTIEELVKADT